MRGTDTGSMKIRIAPRPAPAEIPSRPGSARLFLSIDCNIIPEQDNAAPTSIAFRILGSLMSDMILNFVSFSTEKIFIISEKVTFTLPTDRDTINVISNTADKMKSMINFLDNNK